MSDPITLTQDQLNALDMFEDFVLNSDDQYMIVQGDSGTGKEQPISTPIQTIQGEIPIGSLTVGDKIFGKNGKETTVTHIFPQGKKDIYQIIFNDGSATTCGKNHLWRVHNWNWCNKNKTRGDWRTLTTAEIMQYGLRRNKRAFRFKIPICDPVQYQHKSFNIHPYLLGALIGDGALTGRHLAFSYHKQDIQIFEKIKSLFPLGNGIGNTRFTSKNGIQSVITSCGNRKINPIRDELDILKLRVYSRNRFIPRKYLQGNVQQRIDLLHGLMDTDGSISKRNRVSFATMSLQLAKDIVKLAQSLGMISKFRGPYNKTDGRFSGYEVTVTSTTICPFSLQRKKDRWRPATRSAFSSKYIVDIVNLHKQEEQVCIKVDAQDELYLTDNFIVTHNSTLINEMFKRIDTHEKMKQLLLQQDTDGYQLQVAATTNKAATVLSNIINRDVGTIHSFLKLTLRPNYQTGEEDLIPTKNWCEIYRHLIIIDEASFISGKLFDFIQKTLIDSKVILIGDAYQLAPVKQKEPIMLNIATNHRADLTEIVRHTGQISSLGKQFKNSLLTGVFDPIQPTAPDILHLNGNDFKLAIENHFGCIDYDPRDAKILAWSNDRVLEYGDHIRQLRGYPIQFNEHEYAITNKMHMNSRGSKIVGIDDVVFIERIGHEYEQYSIPGKDITYSFNGKIHVAFLPNSQQQYRQIIKTLVKTKDWKLYFDLKQNWLDFRTVYASTVHKSQGSEFKTVFIDLSDIGRCTIKTDAARLLYVGITRATEQVILYGNLPTRYGGIPITI